MLYSDIFGTLTGVIGLFGLGISSLDILGHLPGSASVILRSEGKIKEVPKSECRILALYDGERAFDEPREDILFLSPSVRRDRAELIRFKERGVRLYSDAELFFARVKAPVFAVSGSDGKSTVTALASLLLSERFGSAPAIGNIGVPMASALLSDSGAYVTELSSFMLHSGRLRAFRGAVTNITENHLDWHRDFEEYKNTKLSLLHSAREPIVAFDDPLCRGFLEKGTAYGLFSSKTGYRELKSYAPAQCYYTFEDGFFQRNGEQLLPLSQSLRKDKNFIKNFLAALALTDGFVTRKSISSAASEFRGLSHRAELFFSSFGIDYIDSSIDTTPERTASTLSSLGRRAVVILGGRGKGLSYAPLSEPVKKYARAVILTGENSEDIARALKGYEPVIFANGLSEAVKMAGAFLRQGDALILSPASTSYDSFRDYKERGEKFKEIIKQIYS